MTLFLQKVLFVPTMLSRTGTLNAARSFHAVAKLFDSKQFRFPEVVRNLTMEDKLQREVNEVVNLTHLMKKLNPTLNELSEPKMERATEWLVGVKHILQTTVRATVEAALANGKQSMEIRDCSNALSHFERIIEIAQEVSDQSDLKVLISDAYLHKAVACIALDEKWTTENDLKIIESIEKAIEFNPDCKASKSLLKIMQASQEDRSFKKFLIYTTYSSKC